MIYEIQMSKGNNIKIDEEDLLKIKNNISANLITVKQAIINPSFMVSISPTEEKEFFQNKKAIVVDGKAVVEIGEKIKTLADKMNINKQLPSKL